VKAIFLNWGMMGKLKTEPIIPIPQFSLPLDWRDHIIEVA
jgi:hypothetical protein